MTLLKATGRLTNRGIFFPQNFMGGGGGGPSYEQFVISDPMDYLSHFWNFDYRFEPLEDVHKPASANTKWAAAVDAVTLRVDGKWGGGLNTQHNQYVSIGTHSSIIGGDTDWAFGFWVKADSFDNQYCGLASKGDPASGGNEWWLYYDDTTKEVTYTVYNGVTTSAASIVQSFTFVADTWVFVMVGFDSVNNECFLWLNDTKYTGAQTTAPGTDASADLSIGGVSWMLTSQIEHWNGVFDEVFYIQGHVPTVPEVAIMYQSGAGLSWFQYKDWFLNLFAYYWQPDEFWRGSASSTDLATNYPTSWIDGVGLRDDITYANGSFYPSTVLGGYSGITYRNKMDLSNDHWAEITVTEFVGWDVGDWFGVSVRHSESAETFYALLVSDTQWKLISVIGGAAESSLATALITPATGDIFRLQAEGTTIAATRNGVEIASVTDSDIAAGVTGVICQGLDADMEFTDFRIGNVLADGMNSIRLAPNHWSHNVENAADGIVLDADCGMSLDIAIPFNNNFNDTDTHAVDHMHYFDIDLGSIRVLSGFRVESLSTSDTYDYDDVTIKTKIASGDDWTTVLSNADFSSAGSGYEPGDWGVAFDTDPKAARYVRIEVNSTENVDNTIAVGEWEFSG